MNITPFLARIEAKHCQILSVMEAREEKAWDLLKKEILEALRELGTSPTGENDVTLIYDVMPKDLPKTNNVPPRHYKACILFSEHTVSILNSQMNGIPDGIISVKYDKLSGKMEVISNSGVPDAAVFVVDRVMSFLGY